MLVQRHHISNAIFSNSVIHLSAVIIYGSTPDTFLYKLSDLAFSNGFKAKYTQRTNFLKLVQEMEENLQ